MKRLALVHLIMILLLACSACCKPTIVPAPCPPPPVLIPPPLRVHGMKPDATLAEMLVAALTDLAEQVGFRDRVLAALDAYRPAETARVLVKTEKAKQSETPK